APSLNWPSLSRSQARLWRRFSGSVEVDVNVTGSSVFGEAEETLNEEVGIWFVTVIVFWAVSVAPLLSVTMRLTGCGPGTANAVWADELRLSPKVPLPSRSQL